MPRDTFLSIANEVHDQTGLDIELCKIVVRDSWREIGERNNWSWLMRTAALTLPAPYAVGTVTANQYDTNLTFGGGAAVTTAMIGMQFRTDNNSPIYTLNDVDPVGQTAVLDKPFAQSNLVAGGYSIFPAYITPPSDFFSWISAVDIQRSWRLNINVPRVQLDFYDARRTSQGSPILLSFIDYTRAYNGKVYSVVQVAGAGPKPTSGGIYMGPDDALYTIKITGGGVADTATFQWKKNEGAFSANIVCSSIVNSIDAGMVVTWPAGTFINGDTFVIRTTSQSSPGLPRFEIYPYPSSQTILPIYYWSRYSDINDPNTTLPPFVPGNYIKEGALGKAARISGTDAKPNPYAQIARAEHHEDQFQSFIAELQRNDEEVSPTDVGFDLPYAPLPWSIGGMFNQLPRDFDPLFIYPGVPGFGL
jgi:hypothetical protein